MSQSSASAFAVNSGVEERQPKRARAATSYKEDIDEDEEELDYEMTPMKRKASRASCAESFHQNESQSKRARTYSSSSSSSFRLASQSDDDDDDEVINDMDAKYDNGIQQGHRRRCDPEAGQIISIKVIDFMCHKNLSLEFGRHVTFITGDNGSGKSAIVAALQLCLGASAHNTGRGNNMAKLIREGSGGPAIVQLKLRNEGPDAFKPEEYGETITIERRITKTRGAGYKFMDEHGTVISTTRDELRGLQNHINAHVDNPCCVLTQEESKKFIQGHERDKYDFFLKATGLEATRDEILQAEEKCEETNKELERKKANIKTKEQNVLTLYEEYQKLLGLDELDGQIQVCVAKKYWFDHALLVTVLQDVDEILQNHRRELATKKAELERAEADEAQLGNIDELNTLVESAEQRKVAAEHDLEMKKKAVSTKQKELNEVERKRHTASENKAEQSATLVRLNADILDAKTKARNNAKAEELVLIQQIDACTQVIVAEEMKERAAKEERSELSSHQNELEKQFRHFDAKVQEYDVEIRHLGQALSQTSSGSSGQDRRLNQFGRNISQIMNAITQSKSKFREMPIGPLGMYVKLQPGQGRQWGKAVEKTIHGVLQSFVVFNTSDQRILTDIFRQCNASHDHKVIYQIAYQSAKGGGRYHVPQIPGATTVNDVCLVDDDRVFNCLVDQCGIDSVILINDQKDIEPLRGPSGFINRQIKKAMYPNVNRASHRGDRLVEDQAEKVMALQAEIDEQQTQQQEAVKRRDEFRSQLQQVNDQIGAIDQRLKSIRTEIRIKRNQKDRLDNDLAEKQADQVVDFYEMENDVEKLESEIEAFAQAESRCKDEIVEVSRDLNELKIEQRDSEQQVQALMEELTRVEQKLENHELRKQSYLRKKHLAKQEVNICQRNVNDVQRKLEKTKTEKEEKLRIANERTPDLLANWDGHPLELTETETHKYLDEQLKRLNKRLEDSRAKAGLEGRTKATVSARFEKAKIDLDADRDTLKLHENELKAFKKRNKKRRQKWSIQLIQSQAMVKTQFKKYLSRKDFTGDAIFDPRENTLNLQLQVDKDDQSTMMIDVRQLSGGERSYTTLCLLMSLGHVIETPFRVMDEYDVFLDEPSRRLTLDELQKYALQNPEFGGRQFIIITPNNLDNIITSDQIKIIRMPKPNRGIVE